MPKRGKGKIYPAKPMAPDIAARFVSFMQKSKKHSKLTTELNSNWPIKMDNYNQLWRWDTLENVNF